MSVDAAPRLSGAPRAVRLDDADVPALTRLLDADPYVNAVLAARVHSVRTLDAARLGGTVFGIFDGDDLRAALFNGGNLVPVGGSPEDWAALATTLAPTRRVCTSIVGDAAAVRMMWPRLERAWGPARAIREKQPLLALDRAAAAHLPSAGPTARAVRPSELEHYLPAAVAMFTEELGVSPLASVSRSAYRRRTLNLIENGRAFAVFDRRGHVVFKADLGAVSPHTCQIHGVWVRPEARGAGIGTAALASVIVQAFVLAPSVSLYVNDFNDAARAVYRRLGMRQVATLSTVLF